MLKMIFYEKRVADKAEKLYSSVVQLILKTGLQVSSYFIQDGT